MRVFELIKTVLDDEYGGITASKPDDRVRKRLSELSAAYNDLLDPSGTPPDYSKHSTRFAYIYKYTTCHANIVAEKIAEVPELRALFDGDGWVDVAAVGGGPGSDFLGVVKYLIEAQKTASLKCYLLDAQPAWGDTWADVDRRTDDLDFRVSTHSQVLDVTVEATWKAQSKYMRADLLTFVYFISEVYRLRDDASAFFAHLFDEARPGALLLFIDNDRSEFYEWFETMATDAGLEQVAGGEEAFQLDWKEEKKSLEPYYSMFHHDPKLGSKIAWRVFRKPAK